MKKTLLLGLLLAAGTAANAQLANGSVAPDFTAKDVRDDGAEGASYSLYADFLENGKSVLIDFSATWCGPCWNFHQSHAMTDLYQAYGKDGSDEIGVIFVEGDINNTVKDNLFGLNVPGSAETWGDWTAGSPYLIFEDTSAMNLSGNSKYKINSFPTIYTICEGTKQTTLVPTPSNANPNTRTPGFIKEQIEACQTLTGLADHAKLESSEQITVCNTGDSRDVVLDIKNLGNNALTATHVVLKKDGNIIAEQDYAGSIEQFQTPGTVTFEDVEIDLDAEYTAELTTVNGNPAARPAVAKTAIEATLTPISDNLIQVLVFTDNNPTEISWEIKNSSDEIVASGGPYTAADANKRIVAWTTVSGDTEECHTIVLKDSGNNGWDAGNSELGHGMIITSGDETKQLFYMPVGNFGSEETHENVFRTTGVLASEGYEKPVFTMYPNPSNGIFNFTTNETVDVTILDMAGKQVFASKGIKDGDAINLTSLQSGVYLAKINGEKSQKVEKIIIK